MELNVKDEQHEKYKEATNQELLEAYRKSSGASYQIDKMQNDYARLQDTLFNLREELSQCKDQLAEEVRNKDAMRYELEHSGLGYKGKITEMTKELDELKAEHKQLIEDHQDTTYKLEQLEALNEV